MDTSASLLLLVINLIPFAIIVFFIYQKAQHKRLLKSLFVNYQNALKDGDKRKALAAGREYYEATRSRYAGLVKGRLTIYDEQAINNDMKIMEGNSENTSVEKNLTSTEELEKLANLKERGLLTEDEYNQQKTKILKKM